jgi:hypothetical protein
MWPSSRLPDRARVEQALVEKALNPFLEEIATQRAREVETIARHLEISLGELIHRANMSLAELANRRIEGENVPGLDSIKDSIARGVENGMLGYVGKKADGSYAPFNSSLPSQDFEISDDVFLIQRELAEAYKAGMTSPTHVVVEPTGTKDRRCPICLG